MGSIDSAANTRADITSLSTSMNTDLWNGKAVGEKYSKWLNGNVLSGKSASFNTKVQLLTLESKRENRLSSVRRWVIATLGLVARCTQYPQHYGNSLWSVDETGHHRKQKALKVPLNKWQYLAVWGECGNTLLSVSLKGKKTQSQWFLKIVVFQFSYALWENNKIKSGLSLNVHIGLAIWVVYLVMGMQW